MVARPRRRRTLAWIAIAFALWTGLAQPRVACATPSSFLHLRTVLLGTDSTAFYTMTTERRNDGSYYELSDSVFVDRMAFDGHVLERRLLRAIYRYDSSATNQWVVSETGSPFDLQGYLVSRHVEPAMPSRRLDPCTLLLDTLGLSVAFETNRETLLSKTQLGLYDEEGAPSLVDYFVQAGHLLVLLRAGQPEYEADYREVIRSIPWPRLEAAIERVWR